MPKLKQIYKRGSKSDSVGTFFFFNGRKNR